MNKQIVLSLLLSVFAFNMDAQKTKETKPAAKPTRAAKPRGGTAWHAGADNAQQHANEEADSRVMDKIQKGLIQIQTAIKAGKSDDLIQKMIESMRNNFKQLKDAKNKKKAEDVIAQADREAKAAKEAKAKAAVKTEDAADAKVMDKIQKGLGQVQTAIKAGKSDDIIQKMIESMRENLKQLKDGKNKKTAGDLIAQADREAKAAVKTTKPGKPSKQKPDQNTPAPAAPTPAEQEPAPETTPAEAPKKLSFFDKVKQSASKAAKSTATLVKKGATKAAELAKKGASKFAKSDLGKSLENKVETAATTVITKEAVKIGKKVDAKVEDKTGLSNVLGVDNLPVDGGNTDADADQAQEPAEGDDTAQEPAEGDDSTPAEGDDTAQEPAEGDDSTPAEGDDTAQEPAEGGDDSTPAEGDDSSSDDSEEPAE